jgi:outer membrane protein assembly factor BamA
MKVFAFIIILWGITNASAPKLYAQVTQVDSIVTGFLPAVSYSSDFGLFGGGIFSRINFGQDEKPFKNQMLANVILSTKGYAVVQFVLDKTRHFDTDYRANYEVTFTRLFQNNFFGIGNETPFENQNWEAENYFYESRGAFINYRGRIPIYKKSNDIQRFDWLILSNHTYEWAIERNATSQLAQIQPLGTGHAWLTSIGTGFYWENRDHEIIPKFGNWTEFNVNATIPGISSDLSTNVMLRHHQYYTIHFIRDLTFAGRVYWRHVFGETPFWNLSDAGFNSTLRGYPFRRFIDKGAITYNLELRTWLLDVPSWKFRLGGYFFTDMGRVFSDLPDYTNLFKGYHQTVGFGGTLSFFNPNFFLRGEFGFSDEISRFYAGVGYLF